MPIRKARCIVLKREDIRETSVILTVFTENFGKLKLISKGVRSADQKFISAYEVFSLCDIVFYEKKRRGMFLVSQCELADFFPGIRGSLEALSYAAYFTELVNFVTPFGERNKELYDVLLNCFLLLSSKASPKRVARIFEIKLLSILGLMPRLKICASCGKAIESRSSRFSLSLGGVLCEGCFKKDKKARQVLKGSINFISHIEKLPLAKTTNIKVSKLVGKDTERILESFIRYHLDANLRSLSFIKKIGL